MLQSPSYVVLDKFLFETMTFSQQQAYKFLIDAKRKIQYKYVQDTVLRHSDSFRASIFRVLG